MHSGGPLRVCGNVELRFCFAPPGRGEGRNPGNDVQSRDARDIAAKPLRSAMKNVVGSTQREIARSKLLLGEGREEELFFEALLKFMNVPDVQIESYGGKDKLPAYLATLSTRPGFAGLTSIAITRDADLNFAGASESMTGA